MALSRFDMSSSDTPCAGLQDSGIAMPLRWHIEVSRWMAMRFHMKSSDRECIAPHDQSMHNIVTPRGGQGMPVEPT